MKVFVCAVVIAATFWSWTSSAQTNRAGNAQVPQAGNVRGATNSTPNDSSISRKQETEEFESLVSKDFLEGLAGDRTAFDRAMKLCADALAQNPKHACALVWHGSGLVFLATQAFAVSDLPNGTNFWQQGMKEMENGVAQDPENVAVLVRRGRTLLAVSRHTPDAAQGRALLKTGVRDYEKVLQLQKPHLQSMSLHARGELLFGLADGWHRLGNGSRAGLYFQRVIEECDGSTYTEQAGVWLGFKDISRLPDTPQTAACARCHKK